MGVSNWPISRKLGIVAATAAALTAAVGGTGIWALCRYRNVSQSISLSQERIGVLLGLERDIQGAVGEMRQVYLSKDKDQAKPVRGFRRPATWTAWSSCSPACRKACRRP